LVDDRQPPHFQLLHVMHGLGEIIVLGAAVDALAHDIARGGAARIEALPRHSFANNVAVGHHTDQPIVLSDRNGADVMLAHQLRDLGERRIRTDPLDASVHHFVDFHGGSPLLRAAMPQPDPTPYYEIYIRSGSTGRRGGTTHVVRGPKGHQRGKYS